MPRDINLFLMIICRCFVIDTEHEVPLELIVSGKTFYDKNFCILKLNRYDSVGLDIYG